MKAKAAKPLPRGSVFGALVMLISTAHESSVSVERCVFTHSSSLLHMTVVVATDPRSNLR